MMEMDPTQLRVRVMMSFQRALLGVVTPSLRGVSVSWDEHRIRARFVYEADDSRHVELVQETETQVLADFGAEVVTDFAIEVTPNQSTLALNEGEVWVYLRREA